MEWQWAAMAIDEIRGLQAEVVLLTPASVPGAVDAVRHGPR